MNINSPPKCELVPESKEYGRVDLHRIDYCVQANTLTLSFDSTTKGAFQLLFEAPEAVRVLDEGQVCEFWKDYHMGNGWLWQVKNGGWMELESCRPLFWLEEVGEGSLREYMIANDQTVFVMTHFPPTFVAVKEDL